MKVGETEKELSVYESMAARFDVAASKLQLDEGLKKYLRSPNREIIVHIPVAMDNGELKVLVPQQNLWVDSGSGRAPRVW